MDPLRQKPFLNYGAIWQANCTSQNPAIFFSQVQVKTQTLYAKPLLGWEKRR